jgi:eukaryotic-like serine/threonine-protein kinase
MLYGRYRVTELIGQGGMATIFRGHDSQLGRDVAIKILRSEYGRDPAFVARFRQEAQSAAVLSHPNVVQVFDFGMESGDPFIVMELVEGGDLAAKIAQGPVDPVEASRIAQQIFEALDTAHARGIVHRDIKPTNVLLTPSGRVKVADFGIARAFSEAQLTMPGTTLGSVHYFSPEQARGEMVTTASDVYSAGLVLFEMLTARRAWTGDSAGAVAVARLTGDPPLPSSVRPGVPRVLDVAVERSLARVPADRPTAGEMAALLGRYIVDPKGAAAMVGAAAASPDETRSGAGAAAGMAAGMAVGASSGGGGRGGAQSNGSGYYTSPPVNDAAAAGYAGGPAYGTVRGGAAVRRGPYAEPEEEEQPASAWTWIAAILAALVLFSGGLLVFLLVSRPPGPSATATPAPALVTVPSFVGMQLDAAQAQADDMGLELTVGAFEVSDQVAENTVLSQDPAAGGQVEAGAEVSVIVATGNPTVLVPDARLRTEPEFFTLLAQNSLIPGIRGEEFDIEVPIGLITRTNPRAGIEVAEGTAIDYLVSLGPPPTPTPTPEITPTPQPTPTPVPTPPPPPTLPPPPPPTPTPPPTPEPTLPPTPSPTPVTVGNYSTCQTLGEARTLIEQSDLVVGQIHEGSTGGPYANDWQVSDQFPEPGATAQPGTAVDLVVLAPQDECAPQT